PQPAGSTSSDNDDSDDCDGGGGESDVSAGCESDDGFDGQCDAPSLTASANSTAKCSRAGSLHSKCSDEASDGASSVSTEPSRSWWRRRLRSARTRPCARDVLSPMAPSRRATVCARSTAVRPECTPPALPGTTRAALPADSEPPVSMLSRLRRTRSAAGSDSPASVQSTGSGDPNGALDVRWTMLKCKGATDLHVVSVPTSTSSLNHKDAFLFYPCLLRRPGACQLASSAAHSPAADERAQPGTLPAHKYSGHKSAYSPASRAVYVWLGAHSSAIKRDAITRVATEVRDKELLGRAAIMVVDEAAAAVDGAKRRFFSQLYAVEHGGCVSLPKEMSAVYSRVAPAEMAEGDADFERALQRRKVLYGFWEAVPPASIVAAGAYVNAAALAKVPAGGAVVLDTWSDVFIWWRSEPGNPAVRQCAVGFATALVRDACIPPRPRPAPVWHEIQGSEHVIFKTKFPDWPFVFAPAPVPAAVSTARQATPPPPRPTMPLAAQPVAVA
ncbi:hypothetical protein LPJ61_003974, partial [Coemansia biformis]